MLIVDESKLKKEIDRLALDHLFGIGAILDKVKAPKQPKIRSGRIAWKRLDATNNGGCDQCGGGGATKGTCHPYSMSLCGKCLSVHAYSIGHGLKPSDEVRW